MNAAGVAAPNKQGEQVAEMVPAMVVCPCCAGDGCVVCHQTGAVKRSNLDRAQEDSTWPESALLRLYRMVVRGW